MKKVEFYGEKFLAKSIQDMTDVYLETIDILREDVEEDYSNEFLSQEFQDFFKVAIFSKALDKYSNLNWYWYQLIDRIVNIIGIHEDLEISEDYSLTESEDAVFNFWNDTDYAKSFLEMINDTKDLSKTSIYHLRLLEQQIISFFNLHIDFYSNSTSTYYNIPELGDGEDRIFSYRLLQYFDTNKFKDGHICTVRTDEHKLYINGLEFIGKSFLNPTKFYSLVSTSLEMDKKVSQFKSNIDDAVKIIKTVSPDLYLTLSTFTKVIVPINESGVVSYSMQSLPDYSCINMYDRDFVDLIDDLLHENGHHYLNTILNVEELIIEDDEKIYYSPWRRSLRAVRGIYHAYLTFFWAFELFTSLASHILEKDDLDFTQEQQDKIFSRAIEESLMLNFCTRDLESAYAEGKITGIGYSLIKAATKMIVSKNNLVIDLKTKISPESFAKITELENHLKETSTHYNSI